MRIIRHREGINTFGDDGDGGFFELAKADKKIFDALADLLLRLTFTSDPVSGKTLIVQATSTGSDLGSNHFGLAMPSGGVGIFNGCTAEWGAPSSGWDAQYGGISSRSQCDLFPDKLKPGCYWRFDWFQNADNSSVNFQQVTCPTELTDKSGCIRNGETSRPGVTGIVSATSGATSAAAAAGGSTIAASQCQ